MRKILCTLLSILTLLACAAPAAWGASAPSVTYRSGGGGASLSVSGVNGGVYGAQLTVTIPGSCPNPSFTPAGKEVYSPSCTVVESGGSTEITIYLTSDTPMNSGSALSLGTLNLGGASLPASGELKLLDRGLNVSIDATVTLRPASSGGSSGSSGGSSGSNGSRPSGGKDDKDDKDDTGSKPEEKPDYTDVVLPFSDANRGDWYYTAVQFVYANRMMSGTAGDSFSPNTPTTRGMIVTILHRLEGSPAGGGKIFPDVNQSLYYAAPIAWASAQGLVNGYDNGSFGPEDAITRQQLAAILYRYAESKGYDTSARGSLDGFRDAATVNAYAVEPIRWAVGTGLISGMDDGTISPTGRATRAQVATILMRFCENVAKD